MIESLLLTAARISTFDEQRLLTNASGFFFERDARLFVVTSRHARIDEPSKRFPDRIEIEMHIDPDNMANSMGFSILLDRTGMRIWRQGFDTPGEIDVAVIEVERATLTRDDGLPCLHARAPARPARSGCRRHVATGGRFSAWLPRHVLACSDRLEEIAAMVIRIHARHLGGFGVGEERHALVGMEVILDPTLLARGVDPHVRMRAITVHLPLGARQAALAHQIGDLVRALRIVGPEIPLHVIVAQTAVRQTLLAANEVGKLHRVAHEEYRRVVADEVVVAFPRCRTSARTRARRARCRGCRTHRPRSRTAPASRSPR